MPTGPRRGAGLGPDSYAESGKVFSTQDAWCFFAPLPWTSWSPYAWSAHRFVTIFPLNFPVSVEYVKVL